MKTECLYCDNNQVLKDLMIEVCKLNVSTVFVFREQTYHGRCLVAYKDHDVELYQLGDADLLAYMQDVTKVAAVMKELLNADKINYGAYSDKLPHLHFHLIPKYADGPDYGGVFAMNPQKVYLTDSQYAEMVENIRKKLVV